MTATATKNGKAGRTEVLGAVTNGAEAQIIQGLPYTARVTVVGEAPLLFHAWNSESVDAKSAAKKGSAAKKEDDVESYVYRNADGHLCLPGANLAAAIHEAAKYRQDPRSPRKSARDLYRAGVIPLDILTPFEPKVSTWDYMDRRRVRVQQAAVTRSRPAMTEGWRATFSLRVLLPQYIDEQSLHEVLRDAGSFVGLCDFRPTYGRFRIDHFEVVRLK